MGIGAGMIPFHVGEILVALVVLVLVSKVITATGQANIFIYIPIAMVLFVITSIVGYGPHLGILAHNTSVMASLILNTMALLFLGISFYKWNNILGG